MKNLTIISSLAILLAGCGQSGPTKQALQLQIKLQDSLSRQHYVLMEQAITKRDSAIAGLQRTVKQLQSSDSITRIQVYYINLKADSALSGVENIDDKALRKYNRAHSLGGILDGLTGSKVSKAVDIFRKK